MATRDALETPNSHEADVASKLRSQYGFRLLDFAGTPNALYERHLMFGNVVGEAAAGARERFPEEPYLSLNQLLRKARRTWHGVKLGQPDWSSTSYSLAFTSQVPDANVLFHVILNAYWEPLDFELPPTGEGHNPWRRWIDTGLASPEEIMEWKDAPGVNAGTYSVSPRSAVVLFAYT